MDLEVIYQDLKKMMKEENILRNEPMKRHTSFKIGGPADIMLLPETTDEIKFAVKYCKEKNIPYFIMGNGTNLLVRDKGIRGVVIKIADNYSDVIIEDTRVKAQAGVLLSRLSKILMRESLEGFEFASGIPGTLGGGVTMNAGAYGGEMKDVVIGATVLDDQGNVIYLDKDQLEFGYRHSIIQSRGYVVLEVEMEFKKGDYEKIKGITDDYTARRASKQPLNLPSAGSVFKRPQGYYAGQLIEECGLRGVRIGDAQVSEKHCGFIVNLGEAKAEDVINLIALVQKVVRDKFNVKLDTEIRIVGE